MWLATERVRGVLAKIQKLHPPRLGEIVGFGKIICHNIDNCLAKWLENGSVHTNSVSRIQIGAQKNHLDGHLSRSMKPRK